MEPYEILEEIRKDCPVKPFPYLLDYPNSMERLRDYYGESNDGARCWYLIDLIDNLLLCKLSIGLFVAAKDGKPLEVPKRTDRRDWDYQNEQDELEEQYNEAQQEVIFEGWEVLEIENEGLDIKVTNSKSPFSFWFYQFPLDESYWIVTLNQRGINSFKIKSLSKLAEATQSNPLKLK
jgi:hypothetical protein